MTFRLVKSALVDLLAANAGGAFRVEGAQQQAQDANEFTGVKRSVRVFYSSGNFPKSGGSANGPFDHDLRFGLQLTVVQPASVDLAVLEDPTATGSQRVAALAASDAAADLADASFDEFADLVFQIIMDARNEDLGLPAYTVGSRWIESVTKNNIDPLGEYVALTGTVSFTCSVEETNSGETPILGDTLHGTITIKDDVVQATELDSDLT
jgi:hypothetical protein